MMAAPIRSSSLLLRQIATPVFAPLLPLQSRTYATRRQDGKPAPRSKASVRSPLIGGFSRSTPQQETDKQAPLQSAPESATAKPQTTTSPYIPPPPPPPAADSATSKILSSFSGPDTKPTHVYSASKAGNFMDMDLARIISDRSVNFGMDLGQGNPMDRPQVRAKSVAGRTVFIRDRLTPNSAPTPAVALRVLDRMTKQQKIKTKYHSQKFHERKGLRIKRLRSERWRARFKTGFKAAVTRALELKKQGW